MLSPYQLQAIEDYKKDSNPMNLSLVALSINPAFDINKKNTPIITALISKIDGSDSRYEALLNYLKPTETGLTNIEALKAVLKEERKNSDKNSKDSLGLSTPSMKSYLNCSEEAETERKLNIFTELFGDYHIEGTLAHSLITPGKAIRDWKVVDNEVVSGSNGLRSFKNTTLLQPEEVIKWTEEVTGARTVNFYDIYCNRVYAVGNLSSYVFKHNGQKNHRVIEYKGNTDSYKGFGTIPSNTPMKDAFSSLDSIRSRM